jgi:hypothetical protein
MAQMQAMNTQSVPDSPNGPRKRGLGWFWVFALMLLVAGAAMAGTWYYLDQQVKDDKAALQKQIDKLKAAAEKEEATVLEIDEWGVEMELSEDINDAKYVIKTLSDGSVAAYFTTEALLEKDAECTAEDGAIGAISRASAGSETMTEKVGDYYYGFSSPQATCSNDDEAADLQTAQIAELKKAFATLKETE